jgi:ASC-1-like (ASCH) protein
MEHKFELNINEPIFTCIKLKITDILALSTTMGIGGLYEGDIIRFVNRQNCFIRTYKIIIKKLVRYRSIENLLLSEGIEKCLPGFTVEEALQYYYKLYTKEQLQNYDSVAIKIEIIE